MVRKQLYIEPRQDALLKQRAADLGVTEAELIRECLETLATAHPGRPDVSAWEQAKAFMEQRMQLKVPQTGRQWSREDAYEERLAHLAD